MSKTNFFDSKIFKSRVTTRTVSTKEKILGHLIGPLGLIFIINTIAALVEKFFTQQVGAMYANNIDKITQMGTVYETVMTITKLVGIVTGILIPLLISKTKSSNGRFRTLYPFFGILSVILGCTIFLRSDNVTDKFWITFFILLGVYHTVACTFFYLFRDNIVSLSSRSAKEKYQLSFIRKASWTLISGIIIGMIINMVVLPLWLEKDINGYALLLIILSIVSIPLILLEFYYTRERIIEDEDEEEDYCMICLTLFLITEMNKPKNIDSIVKSLMDYQKDNTLNTTLNLLIKNKKQAENTLNNLLQAVELGVVNKTTQSRMLKLEQQIDDIERQILIEKSKKANFCMFCHISSIIICEKTHAYL